jgi:hypothetical protein
MWAFAENQREGRSEADSAALAMIWACEDHSLPYHTVSPIYTLTAYRDSSLDILLRLVATCVGVLYCTVLYCTVLRDRRPGEGAVDTAHQRA